MEGLRKSEQTAKYIAVALILLFTFLSLYCSEHIHMNDIDTVSYQLSASEANKQTLLLHSTIVRAFLLLTYSNFKI